MIERQLELMIEILEKLPKKIMDEFEEREGLRKEFRMHQLREEVKCLHEHNREMGKIIR